MNLHHNPQPLRLLLIIAICRVGIGCQQHSIVLEKVSYLPDYFTADKHFGKDLKSIDEQNEIILVTGYIDTTSENPPVKLAAISADKNKFFLNLDSSSLNNGKIMEAYSGNGYHLELNYRGKTEKGHRSVYEGTLVVQLDGAKTELSVVGTSGYR